MQSQGVTINPRDASTHPLLFFLSRVCSYTALARQTFDVICHILKFPLHFGSPTGAVKAIALLIHYILIFTAVSQFVLSGMTGITSHLASQAHAVARNTHSISLAVCALPVPFRSLICTRIGNEREFSSNQNINHFPASPFPINEDVHGPAIDLAIRKTANATSAVLALVRASNLSLRHEISDKLKDFLQRAWACELACGVHLALVKTVIDE
jgi:hypothetical protein